MNHFEYGFFDELQKLAMSSAKDKTVDELDQRFPSRRHSQARAAMGLFGTGGTGSLSSRSLGDAMNASSVVNSSSASDAAKAAAQRTLEEIGRANATGKYSGGRPG